MSDLVGNLEDCFSHNEAHNTVNQLIFAAIHFCLHRHFCSDIFSLAPDYAITIHTVTIWTFPCDLLSQIYLSPENKFVYSSRKPCRFFFSSFNYTKIWRHKLAEFHSNLSFHCNGDVFSQFVDI